MLKSPPSKAAFFRTRLLVTLALICSGLSLAILSFAAPAPKVATLNLANRSISYTDSTGSPLNPSAVATGKPNCGPTGALCSTFKLTIDPSVSTASAGYNPANYQISVQWQWAVPTVDYDWFIEDAAGTVVAKNQSTADPSTIILPATTTPGIYSLIGALRLARPWLIPARSTWKLVRLPVAPATRM